ASPTSARCRTCSPRSATSCVTPPTTATGTARSPTRCASSGNARTSTTTRSQPCSAGTRRVCTGFRCPPERDRRHPRPRRGRQPRALPPEPVRDHRRLVPRGAGVGRAVPRAHRHSGCRPRRPRAGDERLRVRQPLRGRRRAGTRRATGQRRDRGHRRRARAAPARARRPRGVTGVRLFAIGNPTLERLDDPKTFPVWERAAERDLRVGVTILPDQLGELSFMLDRYRATPVVLDHCGFPDVSGGPPFVRAEPLFALADRSNLHLKVSSHLLEQVDPVAFVTRFAAVFGPDRLLWGSDFPQTYDRSYAELVELGRAACAGLPMDQQRAFLGGNALRLWPRLGR